MSNESESIPEHACRPEHVCAGAQPPEAVSEPVVFCSCCAETVTLQWNPAGRWEHWCQQETANWAVLLVDHEPEQSWVWWRLPVEGG